MTGATEDYFTQEKDAHLQAANQGKMSYMQLCHNMLHTQYKMTAVTPKTSYINLAG